MITNEKILEALQDVEDPEIHRSIVELGMVRNIEIVEGRISLELVLTIQGCPLKSTIEKNVRDRLLELGAKEVTVRFGSMTDEERAELAKKLRNENSNTEQTDNTSTEANKSPALLSENSRTKFIAVTSGKGGVGKSTVSVNLAISLARMGKKVGLIDADIYGFSIPDMMGIQGQPTVIDKIILPIERLGVKVMSMGFFVSDNSPVIWRGPLLGRMLNTFFQEVHWGELDYMILDLPPGTGDMALNVHSTIPHSKEIIVTTPHPTAAFVAVRAGALALKTDHEILGVVENMAYYECEAGKREYIFGKDGGKKLAEELNTEVLIQIPIKAVEINESGEFAPAVYEEGSLNSELFHQLAQKIITKFS